MRSAAASLPERFRSGTTQPYRVILCTGSKVGAPLDVPMSRFFDVLSLRVFLSFEVVLLHTSGHVDCPTQTGLSQDLSVPIGIPSSWSYVGASCSSSPLQSALVAFRPVLGISFLAVIVVIARTLDSLTA